MTGGPIGGIALDAATIFAVASGAGNAAIRIMRISGPATSRIVQQLCGTVPAPRRAALRRLQHQGELLDRPLVLWFPAPESYTGEDSAELHLHGGRAVLDAVAAALIDLAARPAEPGEFTRRAFLNGRMDLLEAEAVADLVAAETSAQRRQALRQMEGALSARYAAWSDQLRQLLAVHEAIIDFPDEDLPADVAAGLLDQISSVRAEIAAHLQDYRAGEKLRDGVVLAVVGAPNVGKSSLVNALAERDVAIVADTPGTTRDMLETRVVMAGVPVTLVDTAGLRDADDPVEREGVRRARARAAAADLVVRVVEAGSDIPPDRRPGVLCVANKVDLRPCPPGFVGVSARTGAGLAELRTRLDAAVSELVATAGSPPTQARHRAALEESLAALDAAEGAMLPELRAEELRSAVGAIGRITGTVDAEALLDTVFGKFCIGK